MVANDMIERHLDNWSNWHRNSSTNLGYPKRAMVAAGGGQSVEGVFEELCCDADRHAAEVMEALVNDLIIHERTAVYHKWLGCTLKALHQERSLLDAYGRLVIKMSGRGLV